MSDQQVPSRDDRQAGRQRAIVGLLRSRWGDRTTRAGDQALIVLRTTRSPSARQERVETPMSSGTSARSAAAATASHRRARAARRAARWPRRMIQGACAAATIAALLAVLVFAAYPAGPSDDPRVVAVSGTAITARGGGVEPLRDGMVIARGGSLTVGVNSAVRLLWRDGTMLVLGSDTRIRIGPDGVGKHLHLLAGRVDADVAPQPPEAPLRVTSDDAEITVPGSRLSLTLRDQGMRVAVDRGRVSVRRVSDGRTAQVVDGEHLAVVASGPLRSETTPVVASATSDKVGSGLFGQYFDDVAMTRPVFGRIDRDIHFNFGIHNSPDPRIQPLDFAIRWTGELQPKVSGRHLILCQADDGVRIRIDGRLIMDEWHTQDRWLRTEVDLDAGRRYAIEVDYYQAAGKAVIHLWWQAHGLPQEIIPTSQLFPVRPPGAIDG